MQLIRFRHKKDIVAHDNITGNQEVKTYSFTLCTLLLLAAPVFAFDLDDADDPDVMVRPPKHLQQSYTKARVNKGQRAQPAEKTQRSARIDQEQSADRAQRIERTLAREERERDQRTQELEKNGLQIMQPKMAQAQSERAQSSERTQRTQRSERTLDQDRESDGYERTQRPPARSRQVSRGDGEKPYRPVTSIEGYSELGLHTANSLGLAADYSNMNGNWDQAIKLCRRAVAKNFNDLDVHKSLAEALEGKLKDQVDKDPELFNECIREWVIVLRQEVGLERGMTIKGIGIPGLGTLFADEDQTMTARHHLVQLAGHAPHSWETDVKYMQRVAMQGKGTVTGKILTAEKGTKAVEMR